MPDKDFSRVQFKINTAGSWANLVTVRAGQYEQVKAALEALAKASIFRPRFKALDADGGVIETYGPVRPSGVYAWH